ncbi:hypothetical protein BDN67DRAFT_896241 [Paxillus ammoniavirescens]|nr:hypothetical protein BDN67DRAFT_896241 [Paxillus ammoniavirescens]
MSSSQQLFPSTGSQSSSTSTSGYSLSIPSSSFAPASSFQSQDTSNSTTLADPNSPETFKQNVQIALEHVARVNSLARSTLHDIQNAYQAENDPAQTEADLTALNQATRTLADFLRQTGVGAYPLPPSNLQSVSPGPPSEQQLIADTAHGVQQLYEQLKRTQESSAVVASLLGAGEARSKT